jgi:hypothetical protein
MSVTANEIVAYGCANMPEADGVTVGGAVSFARRIGFLDLVSTDTLDVVSSSASDTATQVEVAGRDGTGVIQTPAAVMLTGTTLIASAFGGQTFQRLLYGVISGGSIGPLATLAGTPAVGDVAVMQHTRTVAGHTAQGGSASHSGITPPVLHLQAGDGATVGALAFAGIGLILRITGGTGAGQLRYVAAKYSATGAYGGTALGADYVVVNRDWSVVPDATSTYDLSPGFLFDILPNAVTGITRLFATAASDLPTGATRYFYEKLFLVNNDTATALTSAVTEIAGESGALPSGTLLDLGVAGALNDTLTVANRQTAPAGIAFVTQPSNITLTNNLPPGAAPNAAGAQGCWVRLTLPAGAAPYSGAVDIQTQGQTT